MGKVFKLRTKSGSVAAVAYRKYGNQKGRFPIFDAASARAALRLRGHASNARERQNIIARAMQFVPDMAKQAAEEDRAAMKKAMKA